MQCAPFKLSSTPDFFPWPRDLPTPIPWPCDKSEFETSGTPLATEIHQHLGISAQAQVLAVCSLQAQVDFSHDLWAGSPLLTPFLAMCHTSSRNMQYMHKSRGTLAPRAKSLKGDNFELRSTQEFFCGLDHLPQHLPRPWIKFQPKKCSVGHARWFWRWSAVGLARWHGWKLGSDRLNV